MTEHTIPLSPITADAVTVVSCGDGYFTAPTGVLFRSIMDHADPGRFYDLIYLHNGAEPSLLEKLCAMAHGAENISIRCCCINPVFQTDGLQVGNREDFSPMTFARLVIPDVLDEHYHRALYLDGDMIAFRDVAALFDSALDGKPVGSTVDFGFLSSVFADDGKKAYAKDILGLGNPEDYFMAAVLVMDLDAMRKRCPVSTMMAAARSRAWQWHDQDVLNHLLHGQIQYLDPRWDVILPDDGTDRMPPHWKNIHKNALAAPHIFHFAGNHQKPWKSAASCYAGEFWQIAGRTPFYGSLLTHFGCGSGTYHRLYGDPPGGLRRMLRRLLPPPAGSVQRDLRNVLDAVDEQTRMTLIMMRQLALPVPPAAAGVDTPVPVAPVFSDPVTVVCCGDEDFAAPTAVLMKSIIGHADPNRCYDILYLHNGLDADTAGMLCALGANLPNISIRTCDIRPIFSENRLFTENRSDFSSMAYARLMIPEVLGADYRRALYLDGDMLAFQDVSALYDSDLEGRPLGSTSDFYYIAQANRRRDRERVRYIRQVVGVSDPEHYILSGMLLMDLQAFRQENLSETLMAAACSRNWRWHDQDVLNRVLGGRIKLLDPKWDSCDIGQLAADLPNTLREPYRQALASPGIFHFAGSGAKPWQRACPTHAPEFWTIARQTPFYHHLLRRLHRSLNTYENRYGPKGGTTPMLKRILKKLLPPPVESVQRDLKTVLDAMDEQKRLSLLLMQQLEPLRFSTDTNPNPAAKVPNGRLRFEFSLAAHCNLGCAGCSHFSPVAQEEFPDFEESKRSFRHLSALFDGECEYIHLLGGEPLLNPQCEDYLGLARSCFPKGDIFLVTNGLLLPKMPDSFFEACRENRIILSVTPYPINLPHEAISRRCDDFGVEYQLFGGDEPKTHFNRLLLDVTGSQDAAENYRRCPYSNVCLFLYRGRMYPCGIGAHLRVFEQHFSQGLELTEADSVDIFSVRSGAELLYRLSKPVPMCRYCKQDRWQELTPWGHSKKSITEWV